MPTLSSVELQMAGMGLSQLRSLVRDTTYKLCRRTIEIAHVMKPSPKTIMSNHLCRLGNCSLCKIGSGRIVVAMSVTIFKTVFANL